MMLKNWGKARLIKGLRRVQGQLFLNAKKCSPYLKLYFPSIFTLSSSFIIMSYKFKSKSVTY